MDAAFEILLPVDAVFPSLEFAIPVFVWDGVAYPQGLPQASFGKNFLLKGMEMPSFIKRKIPTVYSGIEFQCIEVLGDGLDIFVGQLYGFQTEEPGYGLYELLNALLAGQLQ